MHFVAAFSLLPAIELGAAESLLERGKCFVNAVTGCGRCHSTANAPDDAYARRIVGWRVSRSAQAGFVLDALE